MNKRFEGIKAIIFDMDGVLIDSEKVMAKASAETFNRHGVPAKPEDFEQFCGMGEFKYLGGVAEMYGGSFDPKIRDEAYALYISIVKKEAKVYECVLPTLRKLREDGIPYAVASSADSIKVYANIDAVLEGGKPEDYFSAVITSDDVSKNKPDPEIFLKAAAKLGFDAKECLIFEDSLSGVKAAKAAGAFCCGITTANSPEKLYEVGADMTAPGIDVFYETEG